MSDNKQAEHDQIMATIANLNAQTAKLVSESQKNNKELRWYEVMIIIAVTLAVVAIVKLFL